MLNLRPSSRDVQAVQPKRSPNKTGQCLTLQTPALLLACALQYSVLRAKLLSEHLTISSQQTFGIPCEFI